MLTSIACAIVSSEPCETLMTMPRRLASRMTARPRSLRPCHFAVAQHESAKLLAQLCAGQLERAQAEPIEIAQDRQIAVEIESAFEVHEGGDLSRSALMRSTSDALSASSILSLFFAS